MATIDPVADDAVACSAAAGRPLAPKHASSARQPASLHCSQNYPASIAGAATSSLPPFPTPATSYWPASSPPVVQLQHHHPWQPSAPPTAASSSSFVGDSGVQTGNELFAMFAHCSRPQSTPAPFAQLAVPPVQMMQFAAQAQHTSQAMAAAPVESVPFAVVPANNVAANGDDGAKPAPRRRGRPRKNPGAPSPPKRAAPRRKPPVPKTAAAATSRQVQQQAPPANAVAMANGAAVGQEALSTNAAASPVQEQRPCACEEAAMMEEEPVAKPYAEPTVPGVRFRPTNEEIIGYLRMKYLGRTMPVDFIKDFSVYQAHPETVTALCGESVNGCWYVFSPRNRRYKNGLRPARSVGTDLGFWKSNTKETDIRVGDREDGAVIGKVTALTFELGRQPKGIQTAWKMKEFCIPEKQHRSDGRNMVLDDWVLCKIFCNGQGDKDDQMALAEEVDQMDDADEDADEEERDENMEILAVEQGGHPGDTNESVGETEGDATMQDVHVDQALSNSDEDLCVEDYLVSNPTFRDQNHAAN